MTWTIWRYPYDFGNHHMFLLCFYYYICFYSFQIFREGHSVKDHKIGYQKPKSSAQKWSLFIFNRAENLDVYRTIAVLSIFSDSISGGSDVGIGFEKHGGSWIQPFQAEAVRKKHPAESRLGTWLDDAVWLRKPGACPEATADPWQFGVCPIV